jgi:hypothetical protein
MTEEIKTGNEVKISAEDFKLIKSFLPSFSRAAGIKTNDYVIDWNSLMPVVEKINQSGFGALHINRTEIFLHRYTEKKREELLDIMHKGSMIEAVYKAVLEFINWYTSNKK